MRSESSVFFSIIVPVYNVQDYLCQCVDSVLRQTFSSFELILVDDGSKDRSGILCDAYAKKDSRVLAVHQPNGGASAARNNGLKYASGSYILFLDSDDFYPESSFLWELSEKAQNKDIICFNYARFSDHLHPVLLNFPEVKTAESEGVLLELVKRNAFTSSPCLKAVKRSLLLENRIFFEEGTSGEDIEWNAKLMLAAQSVALAPDCVYAYRIRQSSITQNISSGYVDMLLRIVRRLAENLQEGEVDLARAYNSYVAFQYCTILINARLCKPRLTREKMGQIRELSWLLQYDANRIVKLVHRVYRILGFEITSWLLLIYFKLFCN